MTKWDRARAALRAVAAAALLGLVLCGWLATLAVAALAVALVAREVFR